jgi:hypothetical protein
VASAKGDDSKAETAEGPPQAGVTAEQPPRTTADNPPQT